VKKKERKNKRKKKQKKEKTKERMNESRLFIHGSSISYNKLLYIKAV
jgi:hypothetical protein